ncbi:ParB/RepB/Spo0J family partition protein [Leisingera sp. M527]|uniref:ParB/RepB/Spo0J family partition protein n=1 Tax=Leisingera sp. M527 TaxID=2867014 RepID=UPI0021A8C642|nr:ParB/RepB/Spo0J family partition protein [Leisingera sp. M527]UWQ31633.1 ParB/RepB/Spo0J family partition protein [Leisingera sp. M527]
MELQHIELENLKPAAINVRKTGAKDVSDLLPSIKALGLLQPLLVRPNCEGFEIVAGQRRFHALQELEATGEKPDPVPCIIMREGDDAKAIEASLVENIARLPMDEIDQYKAFAALVKQGKDVDDIASEFGITERLVRQRLAIAYLLPPILTAYRKQDITASTVRLLTMATKKQQKAWLALYKEKDSHAPLGYQLKSWLFGGAQILVSNALFDPAAYKGGIVTDLFGDESYFDDPEQFWALQNAAIAQARQAYLGDGWEDVILLDIGEYFPAYDYVDTPKERGGKVYVRISESGEVTFFEGQLSRKEIKRREKAAFGETEQTSQRPEITKAMQNYLSLHRHSAVRAELLQHPAIALRLAVAQIIAGSELWSVQADPQKANSDRISESLSANAGQERISNERKEVLELLGIEPHSDETLVLRKDDWHICRDLPAIFAKLLNLSDEVVMRVLAIAIAECLPCGSALVETLGELLSVDMASFMQADEVFFDLLKDKEAINAMVSEVAGKSTAEANIIATAKVQKKIIADCLNGTRKPKTANWKPRYMAFPMRSYTKRGGIAAIEQWEAIKRHYS